MPPIVHNYIDKINKQKSKFFNCQYKFSFDTQSGGIHRGSPADGNPVDSVQNTGQSQLRRPLHSVRLIPPSGIRCYTGGCTTRFSESSRIGGGWIRYIARYIPKLPCNKFGMGQDSITHPPFIRQLSTLAKRLRAYKMIVPVTARAAWRFLNKCFAAAVIGVVKVLGHYEAYGPMKHGATPAIIFPSCSAYKTSTVARYNG